MASLAIGRTPSLLPIFRIYSHFSLISKRYFKEKGQELVTDAVDSSILFAMEKKTSGILDKMQTHLAQPVEYSLCLGEKLVALAPYLGNSVYLDFTGEIHCLHCGKKTNKSFGGGYCYHHFSTLAQNDMCILKPELCHYRHGTCREPEWGERHCLQPHIVYLANSSGLKVGITREEQIPTRWIDQGAGQAIPLYRVKERWHAGLIEVMLAKEIPDKTNWRTMLKGESEKIDLASIRNSVQQHFQKQLLALSEENPSFSFEELKTEAIEIDYPVIQYPLKANSLSFDKVPLIGGKLLGIKGQYLIFDTGVINIRKHAGYKINFIENKGE